MANKSKIIPSKEQSPPKPVLIHNHHVLQEFSSKADLNIKKLNRPHGPKISGFVCVASWEVITSDYDLLKWMEVEQEYGNTKTLFHGTNNFYIDRIVREGLKPGRAGCMFGSGVYFGLPEKAIGYGRGLRAKYIFESKVVLGKVRVAARAEKYTLSSIQKDGFHSVHGKAGYTVSWGGTLALDEWVVYSEDQILIEKLHEYQEKTIVPVIKTSSPCELVVEKNVSVNKSNRAFVDVLKQQVCLNKATTKIKLDGNKTVWVCDKCIQHFNLRVGSKVKIKQNRVGITEYKITCQE